MNGDTKTAYKRISAALRPGGTITEDGALVGRTEN